MRLKDKVAIITGGAKGIGKETAWLFLDEGAKVVVADTERVAGEALVQEMQAMGGASFFCSVDVTDERQTQDMVESVVQRFGQVDILINNAGITSDALLTKISSEQWKKVIAVNLTGVFNCTKAIVPVMAAQGYGRIINASSVVGLYGNIGQTNYAATKAGVIGLTKSWAKELGKRGITVNAVAPGFIVTDMTAKVPEKVLKLMEEKTPVGRLGQVRDVAYAYLFLASEEAGYINGTVLSVDGGLVV
ncbi:3-oxoacyl-[acyl-carrier-protein] reductase [Paradesulfitobacterium ferrireducens]|uniref:3-oxoacyl-[acyl-carrier-protein] reductase n=1 Tax=Paradesulfitobacterium ferrireducens TaxID=2816476 RepID=UPI001A8D04CF|nr:3-oxoacyl-[acyl-carrier-protein] reductase [Paradesulfitobacterium ferrireducens]